MKNWFCSRKMAIKLANEKHQHKPFDYFEEIGRSSQLLGREEGVLVLGGL